MMSRKKSQTYVGSDQGENEMYRAANDRVAPCLIVCAVCLLRQLLDTVVHARILSVVSNTSSLRDAAQLLDTGRLVGRIRHIGRSGESGKLIEVG